MRILRSALLVTSLSFLASCASIVSKSNWPFAIDTNPSGAEVRITNRKGVEIFKGRTPAATHLRSGAGFFTRESYVVTLAMNGYETKKINVECKLNGWYFGNVLIGGLIGFLIIDPATGAMYKLDSTGITEDMIKKASSASATLNILDKNTIPQSWESHLVKVN